MSHSGCKGILYDNSSCPREVVSGSEWCIFHYPEKAGELAEKFENAIEEEINKQKNEHPEFLDFTGFDFSNNISFENDLPRVYFKNVVFRNLVSFRARAHEQGITFEGEAWFYGATFEKGANFRGAIFKKDAVFSFTTFGYISVFGDVSFEEDIYFTGATFKSLIEFTESKFKGITRFLDLKMADTILLRYLQIENRFYISVQNWLNLKENSSLSIFCLIIRDPIIKEFGKIVISDSLGIKNEEIVAGISFLETELTQVEFVDEEWLKKDETGRKLIIDEVLISMNKNIAIKIFGEPKPTTEKIAQTYRRLRENFEKAKRYSEAGDFFVGEMENLRKFHPSFLNRRLYDAYKILALYGESIKWPVIWSFLSIIILTEIRCFLRLNNKEPFLKQLLDSFYLTFKAFVPFTAVNSLLDIIVKLIGALLIGLIFIAIRRRLERR